MKKKKSDKTAAADTAKGKEIKKKKKKVAKSKSFSTDEETVNTKKKVKSKKVKEAPKLSEKKANVAKMPVKRDVRRTLKKKQKGQVTAEDCKNMLDDKEYLKQWGFNSTMCQKCGISNSQINGYMMNCSRCKKAAYCSVKCFNAHINIHQLYCQTTTIDREPMRRTGPTSSLIKEAVKEKLQSSSEFNFSEFTMEDSSELSDSSDDGQSIGLPTIPPVKAATENTKDLESDSVPTSSDDDSDVEPLRKKFIEESIQKEYQRGKKLSSNDVAGDSDQDSDQKYLKFAKKELSFSEESDPEKVRLRHAETESKDYGWSQPDWTKRTGSMQNAEVPSLNNSMDDIDDYDGDKEMSKAHLNYNPSDESMDFGAESTYAEGDKSTAKEENSSGSHLRNGDSSNVEDSEDGQQSRLNIPKEQLSVSESCEINDVKLNHADTESKEYGWEKPEWAQKGKSSFGKKMGATVHSDQESDHEDGDYEYVSPRKAVKKDLSWSKPSWVDKAKDRQPRHVGKLDIPDFQESDFQSKCRNVGELDIPEQFQHMSPKHRAKMLATGKNVPCIGSLSLEENEESHSRCAVNEYKAQRKPVHPAPSFSTFEKETAKFAAEEKKQYGWEKPSWALGGVKLKKTGKTNIR